MFLLSLKIDGLQIKLQIKNIFLFSWDDSTTLGEIEFVEYIVDKYSYVRAKEL